MTTTACPPSNSSVPDSGARLLELLQQQGRIYAELQTLVARQRALVDADTPAALLTVLADRQRLVDDLSRLERQVRPARQAWAAAAGTAPEALRRRVAEVVAQNERVLGGILAADQQDAATLAQRQHSTRAQLNHGASGSLANRAYGASLSGSLGATDESA